MIYHSIYILFFLLSSLLPLHAQLVATPANIVCYQEVVASQGTYAQINASLANWSQRMYQTLGLTGPIELQVGWARVPDRTGFENGCNGPYPNIADLFVHIQTTSSQYDSVSSQLESFIAANRMTSQPNIVCSARSIVTFLPGCGKVGAGGAPPNNATEAPTQAPSNNGTNNATSAPTTSAPTTSAPTNATNATTTEPPTTSAPTNATTELPTLAPSPTLLPSNETTSAPTNATTTEAPTSEAPTTSAPTVPSNSTETNSTVAGAASDQSSVTGGITVNGASTVTTGTWMIPLIMGFVTIFKH